MKEHYAYLREIVEAAESVGAYVVSYGPGHKTPLFQVVLEWPAEHWTRLTVEDIFPARIIRRLPNFTPERTVVE